MATFPTLSTKEIIDVLGGLEGFDIDLVNVDFIERPATHKVIPLYMWFMTTLTQVTIKDVSAAVENQLESMDNIDSHRQLVYIDTLHLTLKPLFDICQISDFSPADITDPDTVRFRYLISALINFYLFEREQLDVLEPLETKVEEKHKELVSSEKKAVEAASLLEERRQRDKEEDVQCIKLREQNEKLKKQIVHNRETIEELTTTYESCKRERKELQSKVENVVTYNSEKNKDTQRLSETLKASPRRLQSTIKSDNVELDRMRHESAQYDKQIKEYQAKIKVMRKFETDIKALDKLMEEYGIEVEKFAEVEKQIAQLRAELDSKLSEKSELELLTNQQKRHIEQAKESITRQETYAGERRRDIKQELKKLNAEYQVLFEKRTEIEAQKTKKQNEIREKEAANQQMFNEFQQEMQEADRSYRELKEEILNYCINTEKEFDVLKTQMSKLMSVR